MDTQFAWDRLWAKKHGVVPLAPDGFLPEYIADNVYRFTDIDDIPCLVLLGEPGIGKSSVMELEVARIQELLSGRNGILLHRRLRDYSSDGAIIKDVFESDEIVLWKSGNHDLHLFIDDFDECQVSVESLNSLLATQLQRLAEYAKSRLRIRLASRTADWSQSLNRSLSATWTDESFGAFELLPLRRSDITTALESIGRDGKEFLDEIDRVGSGPLASRPVTLKLLLGIYEAKGQLPSTRSDVYAQGCELLAQEPTLRRIESRRSGSNTVSQRMLVAERLAAISSLTGRSTFSTVQVGHPTSSLAPDLLIGDEPITSQSIFRVDEAAVRETLSTALFTGRGAHQVGWSHQTFGEYLAARYLFRRNVPLTQLTTLLVNPLDEDQKVVPQLRELTAWLATMREDVFDLVVTSDPETLLLSDIAATQESDRARLVASLLSGYEQGTIGFARWRLRQAFPRLHHPNLATQLAPYLTLGSTASAARDIAIDIAHSCRCIEISSQLCDITLDNETSLNTRINAAYALASFNEPTIGARLRPLALQHLDEDPSNQLQALALQIAWPDHLSTEELFSQLKKPDIEVMGAFRPFIGSKPLERLPISDFPTALSWAAKKSSSEESSYEFDDRVNSILIKAWDHLTDISVLLAFCNTLKSRMSYHTSMFRNRWSSTGYSDSETDRSDLVLLNDERRRHLVLYELSKTGPLDYEVVRNLVQAGLFSHHDIEWLLLELKRCDFWLARRGWASLIKGVLYCDDPDHWWKVWQFREDLLSLSETGTTSTALGQWASEEFEIQFGPVPLVSAAATRMKTSYDIFYRPAERHQEGPETILPSPVSRVITSLERFEEGDLSSWWHVNMYAAMDDFGQIDDEWNSDIKSFPVWIAATSDLRHRLMAAAKKYVRDYIPYPFQWMGTPILDRADYAGYRALELIWKEDSGYLASLSPVHWQRWLPIMLAYQHRTNGEDESTRLELLSLAAPHAQTTLITTVSFLIDASQTSGFWLDSLLTYLHSCWNDELEQLLLAKVTDMFMDSDVSHPITVFLMQQNSQGAVSHIKKLLSLLPTGNTSLRDRVIRYGASLAVCGDQYDWSALWSAIERDADAGKGILLSLARIDHHTNEFFRKLSDTNLADLYSWLSIHFPPSEDPKHYGAYTVSDRDSIGDWRRICLSALQYRGTTEAIDLIKRLERETPENGEVVGALDNAKEVARAATWNWLEPKTVSSLLDNSNARVIESETQLLDAVLESLTRLQAKLQSEESRAVVELWDNSRDSITRSMAEKIHASTCPRVEGTGTPIAFKEWWQKIDLESLRGSSPKDETYLSDYVKRHLDSDLGQSGVVINREVQNRVRNITDILVQAIDQIDISSNKVITVVVEVKGCWNPELKTAMKTQLVDRYLASNGISHGIYLVGWFSCDKWSELDGRKKQTPKLSIVEAANLFDKQASDLSIDGNIARAVTLDTTLP